MSLLFTFLELDKLYESASTRENYDRQALISKLKELGKWYNFDKYSDEQLYQIALKAEAKKKDQADLRGYYSSKTEKPTCDECGCPLTDGGFCPSCDDGADLGNELWESLVSEANELSTEHAVVSIVDKIKAVYEAGLFRKLPIGRNNAFTVEIEGVDKERLTSYFKKQPEFAYEMHNASGIISHEFISNEYDVEIFDSFVSMYKIPQNESFNEGVFDDIPHRNSWVAITNTSSTAQNLNPQAQTQPTTQNTNSIVTIVYDFSKHKLRAQADDGVHGKGWVAFPSALRTTEGQQYEVEGLVWNGKNYRAVGKITPVNSVTNTQNINENIIKENYEMNFQTILEELDRLYDEDLDTAKAEETEETEIAEACTKSLTEDDDEEVLVDDEPVIEDETPIDAQLVLECSKCGALVIKAEADVDTDEETGLANTGDACQYCEAEEGYKVIGTFTPYDTEAEEEVLESLTEGKLIDNIKKVAARVGADAATILRGFAELGDTITNRNSKFYDFAEYVENKAVLKALMSGNEKVMNTLTKEDIEGLEQAIAAYEKAKADKKAGTSDNQAESDSELDEGILDLVKNPLNIFNESAAPHTIRGYEKGNLEFSKTVAKELKANFGGIIEQIKTDQGVEDLWVDTDGKVKGAEKFVAKHYPDNAFSYDEYDMILGQKDLDELFNTKINVDARGFGGSGNDVDVL